MATRHPQMSFRDRVTTALFGDIYTRDLEFDAKIIARIEWLIAVERTARDYVDNRDAFGGADPVGFGRLRKTLDQVQP